MGRPFIYCVLVTLLIGSYGLLTSAVWQQRADVRLEERPSYVLPSQVNRVLAFGHKGVMANYHFLRLSTFVGGRIMSQSQMDEADWEYFFNLADLITDLDPYFLDPYFLSEGLLAWEAGRIDQANTILQKGSDHRTWDWRLPYFIGFNNFYFKKDYEAGARYLMEAAKRPGSPDYLPTLAARLAYYAGKAKTGTLFLKSFLANTHDVHLRKGLEVRLLALERAAFIEEAVQRFHQDHGRFPRAQELVGQGYLEELPPDPYGGTWGILKNGRVYSSSRFAPQKPADRKREK